MNSGHRIPKKNTVAKFPTKMSLTAEIYFGNLETENFPQKYSLKDLTCQLKRENNSQKPTTDVVCESIFFSILVPANKDRFFHEWFINGETHSGKISVRYSATDLIETKSIVFEDATCFALKEEYEIDITRRMLTLGISGGKFKLLNISF